VNGITNDDGSSDNEQTIKALSNWPNDAYYNIWVVSEIDGNDAGGGTQGYAYFPGAGPSVDGTVVLYNSFGYDPTGSLGYNLKPFTNHNATTIHELGHGLGLYHTFQGDDANGDGIADQCPVNVNPSTDGDQCADTDAHQRDDADCDAIANTCEGVVNSTVYNNFMAYSADECQDRFTLNQKSRMIATLESSRLSLTTSLALTPAPASAPNTVAINCSPVSDATGLSGGFAGIMDVTFGNRTVSTSNTKNDGTNYGTNGYLDFSEECLYYDEFDEGETFDVSVITWFNDHNIKVYVDWDNSGTFDAGEEELDLNTIGNNNGGDNTAAGQITIPPGAVTNQYLRMRFNADIGNVSNSCEAPFHGQVEDYSIYINPVSNAPVADFTADDATPCQGVAVAFSDASLNNPTSWSWDFGDGFVSNSQNPSHSYANTGNYNVTLTATNATGSDIEVKSSFISVLANEDASFSYANASYCTTDVDPSPSISGTAGGSFTANPAGLIIDVGTGVIDVSGSVIGVYSITYTTPGNCSVNSIVQVEIESCTNVPNTKLRVQDCGITLSSMGQYLFCDAVSGATNYEWEISENGGGYFIEYQKGNHAKYISLAYGVFNGIEMATTYNVRVRAMVGGLWGNYSTSCQITTPADVPDTKLRVQDCGITLSSMGQYLFCDAVSGATNYEWEISEDGGTYFIEHQKGNNSRYISLGYGVFDGVETGTTYNVRVRAMVGGLWGDYNVVCPVTTPGSSAMGSSEGYALKSLDIELNKGSENLDIVLYPNPSSGIFYVKFTEKIENGEIEILNVAGQLIYKEKVSSMHHEVDASRFTKGVYFVKILRGNSASSLKKIIVE
jgi:PKD repeat protein